LASDSLRRYPYFAQQPSPISEDPIRPQQIYVLEHIRGALSPVRVDAQPRCEINGEGHPRSYILSGPRRPRTTEPWDVSPSRPRRRPLPGRRCPVGCCVD
jgi:hypothetical protein